MSLKQLQWGLFLLIAIGTPFAPIALFSGRMHASEGIMVLFAGFAASLFVFCFVPYLPKYYLSELLIIIFAFGFVMTLIVNAMNYNANTPDWVRDTWLFVAGASALLVPLITYLVLEKRRPEQERIGYVAEKPLEPPPEERLRSARNGMVCNGIIIVAVPTLHFTFYGTGFGVLILVAGPLLMFLGQWQSYRKAKKDIAHSQAQNETDAA